MAQYLSQTLSQQMRMEQRLTPQLIQSMAVLQKPVTELEAFVANALETNAALELAEPTAPEENTETATQAAPPAEAQPKPDRGFTRLDRFARDYDFDGAERAPYPSRWTSGDDRDPKMGAMANTAGRDKSLQEHLLDQWALVETDDETRRAGEAIINRLDPDGYLRMPLAEVADALRPPLDVATVEKALSQVQQLEPVGVGARDVVECLMLQLNGMPGDNTIERRLVLNHLDEIMHNRLPAVAKATGYSLGEISEAIKAMRSSLVLHPGYLVGERPAPPIRPDVIVEYAENGIGLNVRLSRGNTPHLRIRDDVAALARAKDNHKETRDFARKHVEEATTLIDAVAFRRQRLLEVAHAIAEKQREFFDVGPSGLKVLRMMDLAQELNCDASTISRTVSDKYVQTPRGIFPLRYFFTGGMETEGGEEVGWEGVKNRVKELVEGEHRSHPLNDDQIAELLKKEGIDLSRRTIAKYRKQLGIPAARQRQEY